jgi:hypothetical protein
MTQQQRAFDYWHDHSWAESHRQFYGKPECPPGSTTRGFAAFGASAATGDPGFIGV